MRTIIFLVITAILCFIAGCGPGKPFEIEGLRTPRPITAAYLAKARTVVPAVTAVPANY